MTDLEAYTGADIFDGSQLLPDHALLVQAGKVVAIIPEKALPADARIVTLKGGTIAPGFVDLQVNGGGGVMLNTAPCVATLATMAQAHLSLGTTAFLPTLITDTFEKTRATIDAVEQAIAEGIPAIAGLHLEGPHLSVARKGAHDPKLIRPMEDDDLKLLCAAARRLPALMVTVAPENCTLDQVRALSAAGATISLGHSDTTYETAMQYAEAGAQVATHLFNAMSSLQGRAPGLVGAALENGALSAGLIADGIHVHPDTIALALRAKRGPGRIFLVTDAMAVAGTALKNFTLEGRRISRAGGRLSLDDGTLAGADLELAHAVQLIARKIGLGLAEALAMATSIPADVMNLGHGRLIPGASANFIHLDNGLNLVSVWQNAKRIKS